MADNLIDMQEGQLPIGDGNGGGKPEKQKKQKAPKQVKAPKPGKPGRSAASKGGATGAMGYDGWQDNGQAGGKKEFRWVVLVLILVPVLLIGAFVAAVILDYFGARGLVAGIARDPLLRAVIWLDPEFSTLEEEMHNRSEAREGALEVREEFVNTRFEEIDAREASANTREQQLDRRAQAILRREEELNRQQQNIGVPVFRRQLTEQELEDILSLSRTYSQMSPGTAAEILVELHSLDDVATILYHMTERSAAAVLSVMEVWFAAEITEILLSSSERDVWGAPRYLPEPYGAPRYPPEP